MRFKPLPATIHAATMAGGLLFAIAAQADVTLNAGSKLTHETNVNGSPDEPSTANQKNDSYLTLNASAVYYTPLDAAKTGYFIGQIGALTTAYHRFDNLDNSMLLASVGVYKQLSPDWSVQATGRGFMRNTRQDARDADGLGATLEIKRQLSRQLWVKAVLDYEDSQAGLRAFSYTGESYGVNVGYLLQPNSFVSLGYHRAQRSFGTNSPFRTSAQTVFTELTHRLARNWYLNGGYAYRHNNSNLAGTAYTNHVISVGLNFSH